MLTVKPPEDASPEWTTQIAELFPPQGHWTEGEYLALETNRLIELVDGRLEFLPMPTTLHQWLATALEALLIDASSRRHVVTAPYRLRIRKGRYREADVLYSAIPFAPSASTTDAADIALEVVSEGSEASHRDYVDKRADYAVAGVREYWVIDPLDRSVTRMSRDGETLVIRDDAVSAGRIVSDILPDFAVTLPDLFEQFD